MTEDETVDAVRFLFANYTTQRMKMTAVDVRATWAAYAAGFADLELEAVKAAITRVAKTEVYLPGVATIRAAIGTIAHGPKKTGLEAFGAVLYAMRNLGQARGPGVLEDPITRLVVKSFGWFDMCASKNPDHVRARFIDAYNEIATQERIEAQALPGAVNPQLPQTGPRRLPVVQVGELDEGDDPEFDEGDDA